MLSLLFAFLGSSGFGSILGGIMGFFNRKLDIDQKRMELDHERLRWGHDLELRKADLEQVRAEAAGRREVAVVEGDATVEAARMAALAASFQADAVDAEELKAAGWWSWLLVLSDAFRRFIRPGATVALLAGTMYINYLLIGKLTGPTWDLLTLDQKHDLALQAIAWMGGQTGAALSYWFVSRGSSK